MVKKIHTGKVSKKWLWDSLASILAEQMQLTDVEAKDINDKTLFVEELKMDSLDCLEFTMEVEDGFNIPIPDEDVEEMKTFGDFNAYMQGRLNID